MKFALVLNGTVIRMQELDETPPVLAAHKGRWMPVTQQSEPQHDPRIQDVIETLSITETGVTLVKNLQDRPLDGVQTHLVTQLKAETQAVILAQVPDYKQRNAALGGIHSPEEEEAIRVVIRRCRDECNRKEAAIWAAETVQQAVSAMDS
ncbi:MAG: hypothetical protein HQM00_07645 [Magnetococcales bacterium]|nr:hypothetical protein [Magnetococcales bacterium]